MAATTDIIGPYFSKLPIELILEIAWSISTSSQKNYTNLLLTSKFFYDSCRLTCLPAVPIVLNTPDTISIFAKYLESDETVAPRVHRLWITKDPCNSIIKKCINLVALACDGHDLIPICSPTPSTLRTIAATSATTTTTSSNTITTTRRITAGTNSSTPSRKQVSSTRVDQTPFRHTRLEDLTIMGLYHFWSGFVNASYAPVFCGQLKRLQLLDHLFLYQIDMGWLSSLKHLSYWSIEMTGMQFQHEQTVLEGLGGLEKLSVMMRSPSVDTYREAERIERLEVVRMNGWGRRELDLWVISQQRSS